MLLSGFALLALTLAVVGVYGVLAGDVTRRRKELGIIVALLLTRFLSALVFGVAPRDPMTFAGVTTTLFAVAIVATVVPVRRGLRVSPAEAIRID